jgi:hypothetical protein
VLAKAWSPCLVVDVTAWLLLMPGTIVLDFFFDVNIPDVVVYVLALSAFGLLLLTLFCAFAHDVEKQQSLY